MKKEQCQLTKTVTLWAKNQNNERKDARGMLRGSLKSGDDSTVCGFYTRSDH